MSTALLAIVLIVVLRSEATLRRGQVLLVGLCLVLLPTTGAAGLPLVPPLALWLAYSAWVGWRAGGPGASSTSALALILTFLALALLTPYYFSVPHKMLWYHGPATAGEKIYVILSVLLQVFTLSFGSSAATPWLPFLSGQRSYFLVGSVILGLSVMALNDRARISCTALEGMSFE